MQAPRAAADTRTGGTRTGVNIRDLVVAFRRLNNAKGFVGACVATLGLTVGLNAAVFGVADAALFRPLPYADANDLSVLRLLNQKTGRLSSVVPRQVLDAIAERTEIIEGVAARGAVVNAVHGGPDGAEFVGTIAIASDFLTTLGVQPQRGRPFDSSDLQQPGRAVILTHESWRGGSAPIRES